VDRFDTAIIEFACQWLPYGTPPSDELITRFGMTTGRYEQQLARILDDYPFQLPVEDRRRLWLQLAETRQYP
jgi:hypothetical protein